MGVRAGDPSFWTELETGIDRAGRWTIDDCLDELTEEPSLDDANRLPGEDGICELHAFDVDALGGIFYARRNLEVILLSLWLANEPESRAVALDLARSRWASA